MDLAGSVSAPTRRMKDVYDRFHAMGCKMTEAIRAQLEECYASFWDAQERTKKEEAAKKTLRLKVRDELRVLEEPLGRARAALLE